MLRHLKVDQIMLYDHFCQFVSGKRNHTVGNNAAVSRQRNIRRARADIHKRNVQHTEIFRNRHVDRGNRLQRHIRNRKSRKSDSHIQSVYNILRQKRHNNFFRNLIRLMALQIGKYFVVNIIFHDRIANAVKLVFCIVHIF